MFSLFTGVKLEEGLFSGSDNWFEGVIDKLDGEKSRVQLMELNLMIVERFY